MNLRRPWARQLASTTSVPGPDFEVGHDEPSHISTGGASSEARRRETSRMFSPEWFGPDQAVTEVLPPELS